MKTESAKMASEFKNGSLKPILEKMISEVSEHGLQENEVVSRVQLASYIVGKLLARIGSEANIHNWQGSFLWVDNYLYRGKPKKPMSLIASLKKPAFVAGMLNRSQTHKDLYAELVLLPEADMDEPLFWSGLMGEITIIERERIGRIIREKREAAGLTQGELAEKTGLQQPNIARIETGRYSTGQDILSNIAAALGGQIEIV